MVAVCPSPAVLAWPEEEEESDTGQVADFLLAISATLAGCVQGLEDRYGDGSDTRWGGVLFGACGELIAQPKVNLSQLVVTGVVGPHVYKYLPDRTKVLFQGPLLDGDFTSCY